jgi:uncharacterized SAM-binding protein YcdF (DUF218 family)
MFILDKLLSPLLTPLGLALALIGLGWLLLAFGRRRTGLLAVAVACIGLYAVSTDFVAQRLSGLLERQYPPVPVASLPRADAIILLGGMTDPALPPRQAPDLNEHADRAVLASDLYKAGKAPLIIATGGNWLYGPGVESEATDMAAILTRLGVPPSAILLEQQALDTAGNASYSARIMATHHLMTALLVTSGVHMPRAVAAFRAAGVSVTPAATDIVDVRTVHFPFRYFQPRPQALTQTSEALHELIGMLYYRLTGRA